MSDPADSRRTDAVSEEVRATTVVYPLSDSHCLRPPRWMRMVGARRSSTLLGGGEPVVQTDAGAFSVPRSVQCEDVYQRC